MSARADIASSSNYIARVMIFARLALARLVRAPTHSRRAEAARHLARRTLWLSAFGAAAIVALMFAFDAQEIALMPPRGTAGLWPVRVLTDFGKAASVLWLLAAILLVVALMSPRLQGTPRGVLISFGIRIQFVFLAVLLPVLAGEVVKFIVGRGRPFVGGKADSFNFVHFSGTEAYASFPSSHAITSVALAFAISVLWPRLRGAMIVYAGLIIASRLVLLAHHPSDVVAGALVGVVGAMVVRYWFATRHLAFAIDRDGKIAELAGPSLTHLKRVAREAFAP
jgi:membrane-associated phospholipid phosphatase